MAVSKKFQTTIHVIVFVLSPAIANTETRFQTLFYLYKSYSSTHVCAVICAVDNSIVYQND